MKSWSANSTSETCEPLLVKWLAKFVAAFSKYLNEYTFLPPNALSPNTSDKSFPAVGKTDAEISVPNKEPEIENADAEGCESITV